LTRETIAAKVLFDPLAESSTRQPRYMSASMNWRLPVTPDRPIAHGCRRTVRLGTDSNGTTAVPGLFADGPYNAATNALSVDQLLIDLIDLSD
jgi:hypothetical protein